MWVPNIGTFAFAATIAFAISPSWGADIERLELIRATPLSAPAGIEPSGLASCSGELLTISDKHDTTLYRIRVNGETAVAEEARQLSHIPEPPSPDLPWVQQLRRWVSSLLYAKFDWEGLACDAANNIYLLSESNAAVLRVSPSGQAVWLKMPLYSSARRAGLLDQFNAFVEGIAITQDSIIIAAEREPRGLLVASQQGDQWTIYRAERIKDTGLTAPTADQRPSDFADLYANGDRLYTLERNHSAVCRRNIRTLGVERCWTYAPVENAPDFQYDDARYGLAEGLTVHQGRLYIITDNNGGGRKQTPEDRRPLLFQFVVPVNWIND